MQIASLHDFLETSCALQKPNRGVFVAIYHATSGRPCDDCAMRNCCKPREHLELAAQACPIANRNNITETNSQIAERLSITSRQVSKMRKTGKL